MKAGFHLVSRFRSNAVLYYLYQGAPTGKKGRPKVYDGKIDTKKPDYSRMKKLNICHEDGDFYHLIACSKSLRRNVSLVIFVDRQRNTKLFFSTDTRMSGGDVVDYYRSRFQIEFSFRDGKQFTGLCDCQARNFNKLDFAFNASLASTNVAKLVSRQCETPISIRSLKTLIYNAYLAKRIFTVYGIRPLKSKNAQFFKELFNITALAA